MSLDFSIINQMLSFNIGTDVIGVILIIVCTIAVTRNTRGIRMLLFPMMMLFNTMGMSINLIWMFVGAVVSVVTAVGAQNIGSGITAAASGIRDYTVTKKKERKAQDYAWGLQAAQHAKWAKEDERKAWERKSIKGILTGDAQSLLDANNPEFLRKQAELKRKMPKIPEVKRPAFDIRNAGIGRGWQPETARKPAKQPFVKPTTFRDWDTFTEDMQKRAKMRAEEMEVLAKKKLRDVQDQINRNVGR